MTDDTKTEEQIDLRADDATLDEMEQETEPADEVDPYETPDIEEQARQQAIQYRDAADGASKTDILENAIEKAQRDVQRSQQVVSKWESTIDESRKRIERLEETKERVRDQPDDVPILQTMAGGISFEVPADTEGYDRDDLCEEIDETIDALEEQIDSLEERTGVTKRSAEKAELAAKMLGELLKKERKLERNLDEIDW